MSAVIQAEPAGRAVSAYADMAEAEGLQIRVESSTVYAVWYQADFARLFAWFGGNERQPLISRYCYLDVEPERAAGLLAAPSKGSYLHARIKTQGYRCLGPL